MCFYQYDNNQLFLIRAKFASDETLFLAGTNFLKLFNLRSTNTKNITSINMHLYCYAVVFCKVVNRIFNYLPEIM